MRHRVNAHVLKTASGGRTEFGEHVGDGAAGNKLQEDVDELVLPLAALQQKVLQIFIS